MTSSRIACALAIGSLATWLSPAAAQADAFGQLGAVPVVASPTCGGTVSAEAQVTPVQTGPQAAEGGVRAVINYDAGIYDGSCRLTVTSTWTNLDTGESGSGDITAVSTIDGHYGFIGYANTTFDTGLGTVIVTFSSHPGAEIRLTVT